MHSQAYFHLSCEMQEEVSQPPTEDHSHQKDNKEDSPATTGTQGSVVEGLPPKTPYQVGAATALIQPPPAIRPPTRQEIPELATLEGGGVQDRSEPQTAGLSLRMENSPTPESTHIVEGSQVAEEPEHTSVHQAQVILHKYSGDSAKIPS